MIRLEDTMGVGRPDTSSGKKSFGGGNHKILKQKYEAKDEPEGTSTGKPISRKSQVKQLNQVDTKDTMKKMLCFKCSKAGPYGEEVSRKCTWEHKGIITPYHNIAA